MYGSQAITESEIARFKIACENAGIKTPQAIERGLHLLGVVNAHAAPPSGSVLDLTDDEARDRVTDMSIREHHGFNGATRGMQAGIPVFSQQVLAEVRRAVMPELEQIVIDLRPEFETLAAPLVRGAQEFGFRWSTTSDDVIDRGEESAIEAWRAMRPAWQTIRPIADLRILMSKVFKLSPTPEDAERDMGMLMHDAQPELLSYSVCFAAGENWAYDGAYHINRKAGGAYDWFALAAGGLRLNTPDEVRQKQERRAAGSFR